MKSIVALLVCSMFLCGCSFFQQQTPEQKASLIRSLTSSGMTIGLNQIKDETQRIEVKAYINKCTIGISRFLNGIVDLTPELSAALIDIAFEEIRTKLEPSMKTTDIDVVITAMRVAFDYFYATVNPEKIDVPLTTDQMLYLNAVLDGIIDATTVEEVL